MLGDMDAAGFLPATSTAGPGGSASALGGSGLAVSRYSAYRNQAVEFVRFLVRAQTQSDEND
jgi:ABC-type glycerol-3-phosphate transport system substrate-binding protein